MFNTKVRLFFIMIMLSSAILTSPAPAWACSCPEPRPPEEKFVRASAVFVGTVTGDGNSFWNRQQVGFVQFYHNFVPPLPPMLSAGFYERAISFDVEDSWRGVNTTQITVRTRSSSASCGYHFQQGKQYLVYAHQLPNGSLHVGICSRTAPLANAAEDLDYLQTVPKLELTYIPPMFNSQMLCLAIGLLGAIVLAVMIWRRRYRREQARG